MGEKEIARLLLVSKFVISDETKGIKHPGIKCDLCWNYFDDIVEIDGNHLCHRCATALGEDK